MEQYEKGPCQDCGSDKGEYGWEPFEDLCLCLNCSSKKAVGRKMPPEYYVDRD